MSGKEAAAALAQRWGLRDVAPADLRELAERGLIRATCPGRWPLYDVEGFTAVDELRRVGDARRGNHSGRAGLRHP
jgi:predicted ATPase